MQSLGGAGRRPGGGPPPGGTRREGGNYPWFLHPRGIALYRAGRYGEAIRFLERSSEVEGTRGEKKLVLVMAHQQLGEASIARILHDQGGAWLKEARRSMASDDILQVPPDWVAVHVFLREADALIFDSAFPANPFAP